jgi:hypothetical protein
MLSKWKIWDYVNGSKSKDLPFGVYALSSYDTFFISTLKKYLTANSSYVTLNANEISTTWVESNFKSLGLFGNTDSFCISLSDRLSIDVKEMFLNDELMLENRHLFFIFDKADDFFKKLTQLDHVNGIKIEAPAFWEYDKLLDFIADREGVHLSFGAKQKIIEYVDPTVSNFFNIINKLKVNFSQESISEVMLSEVLEKNKLDNFEMANLFGYKKMASFYKRILDVDPDFETLRSLFYFLQTHMSKISDPRFIGKKSKPSKYDKQILSQSKVWKLSELLLVMEFLRTLEHKAKTKNNFLKSDLRSAYYRAL